MPDLSWPLFPENGYGIYSKPICWNDREERIEIAKFHNGNVVKFYPGNKDWTFITSSCSQGGVLKISIQLIPTQDVLGEGDNFFFINEDSVRLLRGGDEVSIDDINGYEIPKICGSSFSLKEEDGSWSVVKDS
jgi:hypothetical protein